MHGHEHGRFSAPILSSLSAMILALLIAACATTGDRLTGEPAEPIEGSPPPTGKDAWAERTMSELEKRLLGAARVEIEFRVQSEGVVVSAVEGKLSWTGSDEVELVATGELAGAPIDLALRADASTMTIFVGGQQHSSGPRPPALVEALAIGLTRMGVLHNIAVLSGGLAPDHAEGHVREWVEYGKPQLGEPELLGGVEARPLEFAISVEDQWVGQATLWLGEGGLPIERQQAVNFPEGQMKVTERYVTFVIAD